MTDIHRRIILNNKEYILENTCPSDMFWVRIESARILSSDIMEEIEVIRLYKKHNNSAVFAWLPLNWAKSSLCDPICQNES